MQRASAMRSAAQLALHHGATAEAATLLSEAVEVCARSGCGSRADGWPAAEARAWRS
ncbi:hypothetical protein [[Kitasatospora] papulosa]|uniref:hypothetical protein n=1 Tax=[Kitasatospora] papulosa TaxID=1464011 RepID=UPI0036C16754